MLNGRRAILLLRVVITAGPCRKSIESRAFFFGEIESLNQECLVALRRLLMRRAPAAVFPYIRQVQIALFTSLDAPRLLEGHLAVRVCGLRTAPAGFGLFMKVSPTESDQFLARPESGPFRQAVSTGSTSRACRGTRGFEPAEGGRSPERRGRPRLF